MVPFDKFICKIPAKSELERTHKDHQSPTLWCLQKQMCKLIMLGTIARRKISSRSVSLMHKKESCEHGFGGLNELLELK